MRPCAAGKLRGSWLGLRGGGGTGAAGSCGGDVEDSDGCGDSWNTSAAAFCTSSRVTFSYAAGESNSLR